MNRVLIDCAHIDFTKQATGIPRVVTKYIDVGYEWGIKNKIEVMPVVISDKGVFLVDPLPGKNPPIDLKQKLESQSKFENINDQENYKRIEIREGDIVFSPAYWHDVPENYYRNIKTKGGKVVILVHDILPITHAKFYNYPWRQDVFKENLIKSFSYASALFCVSEYTGKSLKEFAKVNRLKLPPIVVSYNGFEPLVDSHIESEAITHCSSKMFFDKKASQVFANKPFIMVGSIEPKKGHIPVLDTFELMWKNNFSPDLVFIGRKGWKFEEIEKRIYKSKYFLTKLFWFDTFDDHDLYLAYRNSIALIFSSISEGFGLPMIEAENAGCPVIAYETQISREVLGDRGIYFNDISSLAENCNMVAKLSDDEILVDKPLIWPSWDNYTPKVFDFLYNNLSNMDEFSLIELY